LQANTDLRFIITSTADDLSEDTNIDDLLRPWAPKMGVSWSFRDFRLRHTFQEWIASKSLQRPRQPAYEIFSIKRRF